MKRTNTYQRSKNRKDDDLPGYPEYSDSEDIYMSGKEEDEIDPENTHRKKRSSYTDDLDDDESGLNLDVPRPNKEEDDEEEENEPGKEDEENDYYSLSDDQG